MLMGLEFQSFCGQAVRSGSGSALCQVRYRGLVRHEPCLKGGTAVGAGLRGAWGGADGAPTPVILQQPV